MENTKNNRFGMTTKITLLLAIIAWLTGTAKAATITWDGGGDGVNWTDPLNWSGNALPTTADDVNLGTGSGITLFGAGYTVRSVQSERAFLLTNSTLTVTTGASEVKGTLTIQNATLNVAGSGTAFLATNIVNAVLANFSASAGGQLVLPGLKNATRGAGCPNNMIWRASGAGSVLDLPALTNLYGGACNYTGLYAENGGQLLIPNVTSITGNVALHAHQTNSILACPLFTGDTNVSIDISDGAQIPLAQLTKFGSYLKVVNMAVTLPLFTNLDSVSVIVENYGSLVFPNVTNLSQMTLNVRSGSSLLLPLATRITRANGCSVPSIDWRVEGAGSVMEMPALTNIYGGDCNYMEIRAQSGGQILFSNASSISGRIHLRAVQTGSVIDVSLFDPPITNVTLTEETGGIILTADNTPPRIITQPQSQTKLPGTSVTFSVVASGAITYQWRKNGDEVSGAMNSSFTLNNLSSLDAADYTVVVSNLVGSVTSAIAHLTVIAPPLILQHPVSQTIVPSGTASFSVNATGSSLTSTARTSPEPTTAVTRFPSAAWKT